MPRVCCAGHVNWDVTLRVDALPEPDGEARILDERRAGGGSAANTAVSLVGLDVPTVLVGSVGDDGRGERVRAALDERGVALDGLRTVAGAPTTVKYVVVDTRGEVYLLGNAGANEAVGPDDVDPGVLESVDHLHLTSQRPDTAAALARLAREAGAAVSFDPGRRLADRDYGAVLRAADVVFVNDREAAAVLEADPDALAGVTVVEKRGPEGAELRRDGEVVAHPGFPVEPVDSTGSGDAFAAGFIAARLDGAGRGEALAFANACGALATAGEGAWVAPDRASVEALVADGPPATTVD